MLQLKRRKKLLMTIRRGERLLITIITTINRLEKISDLKLITIAIERILLTRIKKGRMQATIIITIITTRNKRILQITIR